jgi:cytochrome P450
MPTQATTTSSSGATAPTARYRYIMGALRPLVADPLAFITEAAREHGDVVQFRLGNINTFLLRHPDAVKHVLVDNNHNFNKQTHGYKRLRELLGNGLLTSEGEFWRRQRRIAQPGFHRKRIAGFGETMVEHTLDMLAQWDDRARLGQTVDILHEMSKLTLRIVAKTLLDSEVGHVTDAVAEAVEVVNEFANKAVSNVLMPPMSFPLPVLNRVRKAAQRLDEIVIGLIEERRADGTDHGDLLSMLMGARDDDGSGMTDVQLRDEVMTMFLAGHETTATALSWTFYLLSTHPGVTRRLEAELQEALGGRPPTVEDLAQLPYLDQVVQESLRLNPPAWLIDRMVVDDDVIGGFRVPAGSMVLMSPFLTHRHPEMWPNPEGFDPDRFAPEAVAARPRYAYFPFGGGPRQCIGNGFASMELRLIVATILQRARPWVMPGQDVQRQPLITMRPKGGIEMGITLVRPPATVRQLH